MAKTESKCCFVISPIGDEASDTRIRSDKMLKYVIREAAEPLGYRVMRADEIGEPGVITSQVVQHILDDPILIADLTDENPNVYYELALRHSAKMPAVHIIEANQRIPFDLGGTRTIHVDHTDLESVDRAKGQLREQIKAVEDNPTSFDNPISMAMDLQSLRESGDPFKRSTAEIISMLQEIRATVRRSVGGPVVPRALIRDLRAGIEAIQDVMSDARFQTTEPATDQAFNQIRATIHGPLTKAVNYLERRFGDRGAGLLARELLATDEALGRLAPAPEEEGEAGG